jgi:hypothetical protein
LEGAQRIPGKSRCREREAQSTIRRPRISLLDPHDSPLAETEERHSRARVSANPESRNGDGGKGWIPGSGLPGPE